MTAHYEQRFQALKQELEASFQAKLKAKAARVRDVHRKMEGRMEVSDRASRACNVVSFGVQDTPGDLFNGVQAKLPATVANQGTSLQAPWRRPYRTFEVT